MINSQPASNFWKNMFCICIICLSIIYCLSYISIYLWKFSLFVNICFKTLYSFSHFQLSETLDQKYLVKSSISDCLEGTFAWLEPPPEKLTTFGDSNFNNKIWLKKAVSQSAILLCKQVWPKLELEFKRQSLKYFCNPEK